MLEKLIKMTNDAGNVFINVRPSEVKNKEALGWKRCEEPKKEKDTKEPKSKAPKEAKSKAPKEES